MQHLTKVYEFSKGDSHINKQFLEEDAILHYVLE